MTRRRLPFTRQMMLLQVGVLLTLGLVSLVAVTLMLRSSLNHQYEQRALAVARSVAATPSLGDLVSAEKQSEVQQIALRDSNATGALFVVITDRNGIRLAHPTPAEIGKVVSTDPREALSGKEVASIEQGTLGFSARGKVPLRNSAGRIVGEVSVGFAATDINHALTALLTTAIPVGLVAIAVGALLTALLARRLKRGLFGLEPDAVADLLREHDAVLFGISEGVLAVDPQCQVTMANDEAKQLLGLPIERGTAITDLGLPARLERVFVERSDAQLTAVSGSRVLIARHRTVSQGNRSLGSVLTLRDQTDIEQLTSELASVRNMTGALRAQRHEFANRMHTILGLLQTGSPDDALDYLHGSVGPLVESTISPDAVRSNTIRAFFGGKSAHAAERGVHLSLSQESYVPRKMVAPVEVVTVLGNLVDNAIDATPAGGEVVVDLLTDRSDLVISVANTGSGIQPDHVATIFTDGFSTKGDDRGMGLAIARQTARRLDGTLELVSPGDGDSMTVFVARLPGVLADSITDPEDD
ncbi:ATP-binding protein [Calidifontibacter terrae]